MFHTSKGETMDARKSVRTYVRLALAMTIGAATVFLVATTFAPTTAGLALDAVGHQGTAGVGNRNEASLLVSAYNAAGPIRGIPGGSFSIVVIASPADSDPIQKAAVSEVTSGIYRITLVPELSSHRWSKGSYVVGVTLTSPNGSGVVLAELQIAQ
jgi:hypothetical protein